MGFSARRTFVVLAVAACLVVATGGTSVADVRLPHVIGENMVLQREMPLTIWGWAEPGEKVTVELAGQSAAAEPDAKGKWTVKLPPMKAGGPHTMTVTGKNKIELKNILVGEVWVCSGQSNMQWGVGGSARGKEEIEAADHPKIRLFSVRNATSGEPQDDLNAGWAECSPKTVGGFSAVGYYFGREISTTLDVPVGLIGTSWGGTRIEPWTPDAGFDAVPELKNIADNIKKIRVEYKDGQHPLNSNGKPTGIYNAMVHPLVPFAIRGAIWYQGESNVGEGMLYYHKMRALIGGWRKVWGQGDFPFYYVQLAPHSYGGGREGQLPAIWEAQTAALQIPNTGMAVINDIATVRNIHPPNKQDVGKRLAFWALAKDYGKDIVYSGPLYKSMTVEGEKVRVRFDHTGGGLASRDGKPLNWFTIAGADKNFVPAQAEIDVDSVLVWSDAVKQPAAVRFAWSQTAEPNLINKERLPASAFRTDK